MDSAHTYPEEKWVLCYPLHWFEEVRIDSGIAVATEQHAALKGGTTGSGSHCTLQTPHKVNWQ